MIDSLPDHYATLGLDRACTDTQIRTAYRLLAKQLHPDVNQGTINANTQTQALNAAYETLGDSERRKSYDEELLSRERQNARRRKSQSNITQDLFLRIEECLRGTQLSLRVKDPANPNCTEHYELIVPPETAPGTKFRLQRSHSPSGGFVVVRLKIRPDFRFKVRGSDLRCDLRISFQRAKQGGDELLATPNGGRIRLRIPRSVERNEIIRIIGEGLPKARGGRGDLMVRVIYRPEVKFKRMK